LFTVYSTISSVLVEWYFYLIFHKKLCNILFVPCAFHIIHILPGFVTSKLIATKQENIFGEDQAFTDMHQSRAASSSLAGNPATGTATPACAADRGADISTSTGATDEADLLKQKEFDTRQYRPFEVAVSITMHDIQAHLIKVSD
jgi:hypothetical protein